MDRYIAEDRTIPSAKTVGLYATRNVLAIFCILVFLGFPGNLSRLIGSGPSKMVEYISFAFQFVLVMLASGDDVMNLKLVSLYPAHWLIYTYVVYVTADSLIVADDKKALIITLLHLILTVMFALWLIELFELEEMLELFYYAQVIYIMICLVCVVAFKRVVFQMYQGSQVFVGLYENKNGCGTELSFAILVQCILMKLHRSQGKRESLFFFGLIGIQFAFMLLSKNAGAIFITIGYISYILYYGMLKKKWRIPIGLMFVAGTIGFLFFALTVLQAFAPFLESIGKDASLTGRVPIWNQLFVVMQESHTLTGWGYEMFWRTPSARKMFQAGFSKSSWAYNYAMNSHNTIVELWCTTGLIGVVLYYFMFLSSDRGVKHLSEEQYLFCSSYMVMFMIRAFTERQTGPSTIYFLIFVIVLAMEYQAIFNYKQSLKKTAHIYVHSDAAQQALKPPDNSDLAAFQMRFSNQAGSGSRKEKKPVWDQDSETGRSGNQLEELLSEFDDDL